jgi:hypothetical protein
VAAPFEENDMRHPALITGLCLALSAPLAMAAAPPKADKPAAASAATPAATPAVDPQAVAALESMGKYLRSLKDFTVHADTTIELVTDDSQKLQFPGSVD